ncbi:MAG: hypothetical protein B5M51_06170 [Anaerolinea sp. 4484_236]|nr:MAG: hypothetical protein B5M51_06170 [Anaerolinea sp. 4484_236]
MALRFPRLHHQPKVKLRQLLETPIWARIISVLNLHAHPFGGIIESRLKRKNHAKKEIDCLWKKRQLAQPA